MAEGRNQSNQKTKYSDLSLSLKIAIVFAWIAGILIISQFAIGFISGVLGY